jgi:hypothetical protein
MLASSSLIVMILLLLIIIMLVVLMFQSSLSLAFSILRSMGRARAVKRPPAFRIRVAVAPTGDGARSKGTPFAYIFHKEVRFSRVLKNARLIGNLPANLR